MESNTVIKFMLVVILFSIFTTNISAQECNYTVDVTDKFTGKTNKELSAVLLSKKAKSKTGTISNVKMILKKENDQPIFTLLFVKLIGTFPVFVKGDKLLLLLKDSKKVELTMTRNFSDNDGYKVYTHFDITKEDLVNLEKSDITDIRILSSINGCDMKVSSNVSTAKYFKCIK